MALATARKHVWERDGFLVVEDLFSQSTVEELREEVESVLAEVREEQRAAGKPEARIFPGGVYVGLSVRRELFRKTARDPRVLDILEELIGPEIGFLSDKVVFKSHEVAENSPWHQDWAYWGGSHKISIWVALDEATLENGCLQILPGSHQAPIEHRRDAGAAGFGTRLDPAEHALDLSQARVLPARPGTAIFFHDLALHASLPNRSGASRRALILTYRDLSQPDLDYPSLPAAARVRG